MPNVTVYHYDAFSSIPNKGNPAGVVLDGGHLSEEQMLEAAAKVGFNETAFPLPSEHADLRIRYFTPGHEINLCGHATMATLYALHTKGLLGGKNDLTIETKAGILPISIRSEEERIHITMRQAAPQFQPFSGSLRELAHSMGLEEGDIETTWPTVYGSTGTWTLLIPIKHLDAFHRMKPNNHLFPEILKEMPRASLHPFCLAAHDSQADMHARHFSSPFSGTVEDPVTGTASGVMGAYFARFVRQEPEASFNLTIEQGQEVGRDGRVSVSVTDGQKIEVTGTAVYVDEFVVSI
ncbi:PhzF family phenazine biosynthesis protein [Paenibacillus sp. SYP-B4298]|uniref:PhzF family phenazine biosynthesis protein n=1 Tax=Paenibacillus sp. SYP-B4298 TaxID=2996034 RepID=UPI0022DE4E36|nr:PhzF family phenazine biosynthesis isomerase [Paenibacillus sp. SYP-B4298]